MELTPPCDYNGASYCHRKENALNPDTDALLIEKLYRSLAVRVATGRTRLGRPLTLAEKILFSHLKDPEGQDFERGRSYILLQPDRVAMQDATAQMAVLQFMLAGRESSAVPATVHCDHLIRARQGASEDMKEALLENDEVYAFLRTAASKYGIGFWKPGAGIIHQVVIENYAFPGGLMLGTDSHTPNAGGLGMMAVGVGGADAVDVMVGDPWEVQCPKLIGIHLKGALNGWTSPKDVILKVCGVLTTKGGTGAILEYFGPGAASISATGKATITNMGAELGATTSIFPYDERTRTYLKATRRPAIAALADAHLEHLVADPEVAKDPERFFDRIVEIDLSTLEPHIVGPHSPDVARPIGQLADDVKSKPYKDEIKVALIGSCTNSSYEDIGRAARVAAQAAAKGLKAKVPFMVTPGSDLIYETIKRDGQMEDLEKLGAKVLANACGPCIGQWKREDVKKGEPNTILTSYNRNFPGRNDANPDTMAFIGSPEVVTAMALSGSLSFNPLTDTLEAADGSRVRLDPPDAPELPENGFVEVQGGFLAPAADSTNVEVVVQPESERLQVLQPFPPWDGEDLLDMLVLMKATGKCTTDHISPAGPWLRYRGHLERISDNLFSGAINAFTGERGAGTDRISGDTKVAYSEIAKRYKSAGKSWVAIGDVNYGEGSSREHAAMEPRFLGGRAVIVRSFARIHETNLKKQGLLPLTFADPAGYDKIREDDLVSLLGLSQLASGRGLTLLAKHSDGSEDRLQLHHSFNAEQVEYFRAGSALNLLRERNQAGAS
jgi:aconitate hydratase